METKYKIGDCVCIHAGRVTNLVGIIDCIKIVITATHTFIHYQIDKSIEFFPEKYVIPIKTIKT